MRHLLALVGALSDLDDLLRWLEGDHIDIVQLISLWHLGRNSQGVADSVKPDSPLHVVPDLHGFGDDFVDVLLGGANAVGNTVDDNLRGEEAVATPFLDVLALAGVPLRRAEGVLPSA